MILTNSFQGDIHRFVMCIYCWGVYLHGLQELGPEGTGVDIVQVAVNSHCLVVGGFGGCLGCGLVDPISGRRFC